MNNKMVLFVTGILALLASSVIASLTLGAASTTFADVFQVLFSNSVESPKGQVLESIIWQLRMPRTILAFVAGAGLALAGLILQIVTRNPLADPYLFGISSGASFGAVLAVVLLGSSFWLPLPVSAFIGSLLAVLLLIGFASATRFHHVESLVLAGVALTFLFSAFTSLLLYWSDPQVVASIIFWTLGSFARADWQTLWWPVIMVSFNLVLLFAYQGKLIAMILGDESAITLGINVRRLRFMMLISSSLITASVVALCGGIGFVGLMIPHIVRQFINVGSKFSFALTALAGGVFMLWVDVIARIVLSNQELPIGIITSAIGSVFFLMTLYIRTRNSFKEGGV